MIPFAEICDRFKKLYVPAISDILDDKGYKNQALPNEINPISSEMKLAGKAFTLKGTTTADFKEEYIYQALKMLQDMSDHSVFVMDTSHDNTVAHFGELMCNLLKKFGCVGAVIDGGVRDFTFLLKMNFPVFARYSTVVDALGRYRYVEHQVPIRIGSCLIHPGDFVVGDVNGVVIVPKETVIEVLIEAESLVETENKIRQEIQQGGDAWEIYKKYGRF